MGLADEINASREDLYSKSGPACTVKTFLALLAPDDRLALEALIQDHAVYGTRIAKLIDSWGDSLHEQAKKERSAKTKADLEKTALACRGISDRAIQRHRRRNCACRGAS